MTCDCATTRFLLAACAWLGLICQQVTVASGCCTFVADSVDTDQTPASGVPGKDSTSLCCGPATCGDDLSQSAAASDCSGPCCGRCCDDIPIDATVLVSRLPVPTAFGVFTPIVIDEPDKTQTGTRANGPGAAAEEIPLQRRLARLKVWLN